MWRGIELCFIKLARALTAGVGFVLICMVASCPVCAANLVVNGDFETGDLRGWVEAGNATIPRYATHPAWAGPVSSMRTPAQVFSAEVPLYVYEFYDDGDGMRHMRMSALAHEIKPKAGYSVGWTRTGVGGLNFPWISQVLRVAPGRYLLNASWDVMSMSSSRDVERMVAAGIFAVHADDRVNEYTMQETKLRQTVWNTESRGEWVSRSVKDFPIETNSGLIEVRLMVYHGDGTNLVLPDYETVAFDNVVFDLTPTPMR